MGKKVIISSIAILLGIICAAAFVWWIMGDSMIKQIILGRYIPARSNVVDSRSVKTTDLEFDEEWESPHKKEKSLAGLSIDGPAGNLSPGNRVLSEPVQDSTGNDLTPAPDPFTRIASDGVSVLYTPGINWTKGEISNEDYNELKTIACRLLEQNIIRSKKDTDPYVEAFNCTPEELQLFKTPIVYYVDQRGVITLNLKLHITLGDSKTKQEVLTPVKMRYQEDYLVLTN